MTFTVTRYLLAVSVPVYAYCGLMAAVLRPWPAFLAAVAFVVLSYFPRHRELSALGTARWCDAEEAKRNGLTSGSGLNVGELL